MSTLASPVTGQEGSDCNNLSKDSDSLGVASATGAAGVAVDTAIGPVAWAGSQPNVWVCLGLNSGLVFRVLGSRVSRCCRVSAGGGAAIVAFGVGSAGAWRSRTQTLENIITMTNVSPKPSAEELALQQLLSVSAPWARFLSGLV